MARGLTVQEIVRRWQDNASNATTSFKNGVQAVSENPMQKAANAQDKYADGCRRAAESGKFAAGCQAVPMQAWKDATLKKGADRFASGVKDAVPKVAAFWSAFKPAQDAMVEQVSQMPSGTKAERKARMNAMFDAASEWSYRGNK